MHHKINQLIANFIIFKFSSLKYHFNENKHCAHCVNVNIEMNEQKKESRTWIVLISIETKDFF